MASTGWVLDTATNAISLGLRPAALAAAAMVPLYFGQIGGYVDICRRWYLVNRHAIVFLMSAATLAKLSFRLNRASDPGGGLPGMILMTDPERLPNPLSAAVRLPAGSAIILRHYDFWNREDLGRQLMNICRQRHVCLLVSADYRLAWKIGAHGVHLPEALAKRPPLLGRRPGWLVTAAAHSPAALNQAVRIGADAALLSPVFATQSHPRRPLPGRHAVCRHGTAGGAASVCPGWCFEQKYWPVGAKPSGGCGGDFRVGAMTSMS